MPDVASPPGITIVPATPNKGIKMGGEIHLGTPSTPTVPPPAPKPGSAKEGMSQRLRQKAGLEQPADPPVTPPVKPSTPPEQPAKPNEPTPDPGTSADPQTPSDPTPPETPTAPDAKAEKDKEKIKPWKIVDQYKEENKQLKAKLATFETAGVSKEVQERISKAESRVKELEDEIRFVNYEKSPEFKTKYQEPYEKAWERATKELAEISIAGPDGQQRAVTAQDILDLVNLPLGKARELANSLYGDFADDAMAHRKEIRSLHEQKLSALEEAKKTGAERELQLNEAQKKASDEMSGQVKTHWAKANSDAINDPKNGQYFQPIEGDEEWNQRLAKGFSLVDRAFSEDPLDKTLTNDQRVAVVRRHAAVRNRAAAFGPLKHRLLKSEAKVAALEKELAQYKGSEPTVGGRQGEAPNGQPATAKDQVFGKLRGLAAR